MSLIDMLKQIEQSLHKYFEKEIADNHISTPFSLPAECNLHIKGNADLLSMTVMSLLRNALYAVIKKKQRIEELAANGHQTTDPGQETYQPEVRLSLNIDNGKAIVTVHDNGIGIESAIIDRIFDPFFTTKTTGEASGVGLYISREIVQNHGGDIVVSSVKGSFTEFNITLPI